MADNMMRIAGRGEDGLAKSIKTDNQGNLYTKSKRGLIAEGVIIGESVDVSEVVSINVHVKQTANPYKIAIHFEESYNGVDWIPITVSGQSIVDAPGRYSANIKGSKYLRFLSDNQHQASFVCDIYSNEVIEEISTIRPSLVSKRFAPCPPRVSPEIIDTGGMRVGDINPKIPGTIYAYGGASIRKSVDYGKTFVSLIKPWIETSSNVRLLKRLSNGRLLVAVENVNGSGVSKVYVSDVNELNFVEKFTFNRGFSDMWGGFFAYGDIIGLMPYVTQPRTSLEPIEFQLSTDGGMTFSVVFTAPELNTWHNHDIAYDPYDDMLWILNGDGATHNNVRYSFNFGKTWHTLWQEGKCPYQFTNIACLPDAIVLGSDDIAKHGMYTLPRLKNKTEHRNWGQLAKPSYFVSPVSEEIGAVPTTKPAVRYDVFDTPVMYMTARTETSELIATKNGSDFYTIWSLPKDVDATVTTGILALFGPDDNNKIVGLYQTVGAVPKVWVADAPVWVEI